MREEGKPHGEGTSKKNQKGSQVRNEGASECCSAGKTLQYQGRCVEKQRFHRDQKILPFYSTGQNGDCTVQAGHSHTGLRDAICDDPGCRATGESLQDPGLLGGSSLLHLLAFTSCYFFLFPLTSKTDQSPSSCSYLSRPSTFVSIICKPRCQINSILFLNLLKYTLSKECVYLVINSTYIGVPTTLRMFQA